MLHRWANQTCYASTCGGYLKLGAPKWMIYNGKSYYSGWFRGYPDVRQPLLYVKKVWIIQPVFVSATCVELDTETSHLILHSMYTLYRLNPRYRLPRGQHSHTRIPAFAFSGILYDADFWFSGTAKRAFEDSIHITYITGTPSWDTSWNTHAISAYRETTVESPSSFRLDDPIGPRDWEKLLPFTRINKSSAMFSSKTLPEATLEFSAFLSQLTFRDEPLSKHSDCYVPVPLAFWSILGWLTPQYVYINIYIYVYIMYEWSWSSNLKSLFWNSL